MQKDFQEWHNLKSNLHNANPRLFFHEREIWLSFVGANVGFEQDGQGEQFLRPIVVVSKFNNEIFLGVPLSKTDKQGKFYFQFSFVEGVVSNALLSQTRLFDAKRLKYKLGDITTTDFAQLKSKIRQLLA